jgi:hypothetical protein
MNDTVAASIERQLAELGRLVPRPPAALGYGSDLSCVADLTPELAEVEPFTMRAIGEAVVRRLTTPRGSLPDDPDYGLDVRVYANRGTTLTELRELGGRCALELGKDDRIDESAVIVMHNPAAHTLGITVRIVPASPTLNPFTLTFTANSGAAVLEAFG